MRMLILILVAAGGLAAYRQMAGGPTGALAADNDVVMVRPDYCPISDRRETELKQAGIPYRVLTPGRNPKEVDAFMRGLIAQGRTSGATPIMRVNGAVLEDNSLRSIRKGLRYRD